MLGTVFLVDGCGSSNETPEPVPTDPLTPLVDPFIGTGGRGWRSGNVVVGATTPFGMVQKNIAALHKEQTQFEREVKVVLVSRYARGHAKHRAAG